MVPDRAMVLAAGRGQRLRPLTAVMAKPSLPFLGTGLIEYSLRRLGRMGVAEAVVNLFHLPATLEPLLDDERHGVRIRRSTESRLLGTAGGLKRAERHLRRGTFLVMNGDTILDFDLEALIDTHVARGAEATLVVRSKSGGGLYSTLALDRNDRIVRVEPKSRGTGLMFAGVWLMEPSVLGYLSGAPAGLEVELLPRLIEKGTGFASVQNGAFVTIDTPGIYWSKSLDAARGGLFAADWGLAAQGDGLFCGRKTRVAPSARIEGTVVLGDRCRVGRGAHVKNVVAWNDVIIPAGARLESVVLTHGVRLEARAELAGRLVMNQPPDTSRLRRRELAGGLVIASLDTGAPRAPGLSGRGLGRP